MESFGKYLQRIRVKKGFKSAKSFAKECEVTLSVITNAESNKSIPKDLDKIAGVLGMTSQDLIAQKEPEESAPPGVKELSKIIQTQAEEIARLKQKLEAMETQESSEFGDIIEALKDAPPAYIEQVRVTLAPLSRQGRKKEVG